MGTFYLTGYAVECGLKSCVLTKLIADKDEYFPDKQFSNSFFTHNLEELLKVAGLKDRMEKAGDKTKDNWQYVMKERKETARYDLRTRDVARSRAEALFQAVTESEHGVLPWVKKHW